MLWAVLFIPLYAESTEFSELFSLPFPSFCCEKVGCGQPIPCSGNKEGEITLPLKLHAQNLIFPHGFWHTLKYETLTLA